MRSLSEFRSSNFDFRVSNFEFRIASFLSRQRTLFLALLIVAIGLGLPTSLSAQGCAMCYTSAAAAKKAGLQALREGILVLGIPPLVMFIGIFLYVFRRREHFGDTNIDDERGFDDTSAAPPPSLTRGLDEEPAEDLSLTGWHQDCSRCEGSISSRPGH
ncbi:MAG: hypothetical protein ACE145_06380 [Terriglobia bacterium]